jgi:hypothetical protein
MILEVLELHFFAYPDNTGYGFFLCHFIACILSWKILSLFLNCNQLLAKLTTRGLQSNISAKTSVEKTNFFLL